jgi:beta-N-acetylhexosaminidase
MHGTPATCQQRLAAMTLEERLGQMLMVRYPDRAILAEMLARGQAGSFYFSMKGKPTADVIEELNRLQRLARVPALVAFGSACCDCGTGLLNGNQMRLGATRSPELAYELARSETTEQRAYGFHVPGTPVLDVNTNPANPIINTRAFSDDPGVVTELGLAMLRGIVAGRGVTCAMHFPGHGATAHDSHIGTPTDDRSAEEIRRIDLAPYRAAISQGLINGLCTNHVHYPAFEPGPPAPATVSRRVVTALLRDELGYDGVVMSDSLTMRAMKSAYGIEESAVLAACAGHDILLQDYESDPRITLAALVKAVESGRLPLAQVEASALRVLRLKEWLGLFDSALTDPSAAAGRVATPAHRALALRVAREAVTVLEDAALPLSPSPSTRCLVVTTGAEAARNVDMDIAFLPTGERFVRAIRRRLPQADVMRLETQLEGGASAAVLRRAAEADVVVWGLFTRVVCYHEESIGVPPDHVHLIRQIAASRTPLVLLNFGNPYLMKDLPRAAGALCTYDQDCPESIEAGVEALFGGIRARGKLPVAVSRDYPFGFGRG